ncbi:MAG: hypothetical protein IEMM0006_1098 [bacterium]|nr:MAG: hypothetical protein IEMM0006_1098 [bacterium]
MWTLNIVGWKQLRIKHLVFDYNGTLSVDGKLLPGIAEKLILLAEQFSLHVVTADTFGMAAQELENIPCMLTILPKEKQAEAKREYVKKLGAEQTAVLGNGCNDRLMLTEAALGIVLLQAEGAAVATFNNADVVCKQAADALDLFLHPKRLAATLRG